MRFLLDTNILGEIAKPSPSASLTAWMSEQDDEALFIASLTVAEIWRGVLEKPMGKRRDLLEAWFSGPEGPQAIFAGRVLPFDDAAGLIWARLMAAAGKVAGRPRRALDTIIAAVAEANGCVVVTNNEKDFPDVEWVNPLRSGAWRRGKFSRQGAEPYPGVGERWLPGREPISWKLMLYYK